MTNLSSSPSTDQSTGHARAEVAAWLAELAARHPPFHLFPRDREALALGCFDLELERLAAAHLARYELLDALRARRLLVIDGPQRCRCFEQHKTGWVHWYESRTARLVRTALDGPRPREVSLEEAPAAAVAVAPLDSFAEVDQTPTWENVAATDEERLIAEAITRLPPAEREMAEAVLAAPPGLPLAAIAAERGIEYETAKKRFQRALKHLAG